MDRSTEVTEIIESLHDELDPSCAKLTDFQVGAVLRLAAELVVDRVIDERAALLSYIKYCEPNNIKLHILLNECQKGIHRRKNASKSMGRYKVIEKK